METKKEVAKAKRICQEIAGKIHDIVEETLWTDYGMLPELSQELIVKIQEYEKIAKNI